MLEQARCLQTHTALTTAYEFLEPESGCSKVVFALSVVLIASIVLQNLLECLASLALSKVQAIKASGQVSVANLHLK